MKEVQRVGGDTGKVYPDRHSQPTKSSKKGKSEKRGKIAEYKRGGGCLECHIGKANKIATEREEKGRKN